MAICRPVGRNKLAFPGGRPGFSPSHPAVSRSAYTWSAVSVADTGGLDLTTGKPGVVAGTVGSAVDATMGPTNSFVTSTSDQISFSGKPATADTQFTIAAIYKPTLAIGTTSCYAGNSSNTNGLFLGHLNSTTQRFAVIVSGTLNSASIIPTNLPVINIPYFVAGSGAFDGANWTFSIVARRLDTGTLEASGTATGAGTAMPAPSGSYGMGSRSGNASARGNVSAAMYSKGYYMSLPDLTKWSANPWAFWYPK